MHRVGLPRTLLRLLADASREVNDAIGRLAGVRRVRGVLCVARLEAQTPEPRYSF